MYEILFEVLRKYPNQKIQKGMLEEMGLKPATEDCWWSNKFQSSYFSINVSYEELVVDIIERVISSDVDNYREEMAESLAGEDW